MNKKPTNEKIRYKCNVVSHWRIFLSAMEERGFRIESRNWVNVLCVIEISTVFNLIKWILMTRWHMWLYISSIHVLFILFNWQNLWLTCSSTSWSCKQKIKALFCWIFASGIHRSPVYYPTNVTVIQKAFIYHDVRMCLTAFYAYWIIAI